MLGCVLGCVLCVGVSCGCWGDVFVGLWLCWVVVCLVVEMDVGTIEW